MLKYTILATIAFAGISHAEPIIKCNPATGNWVNAAKETCLIIADNDQGTRAGQKSIPRKVVTPPPVVK